MNLNDLHSQEKAVSAVPLFEGATGSVTSLHLKHEALLKEHVTKVPALLVCATGAAMFEDAQGAKISLSPGDYVSIKPMVTHWVKASMDCNLLLVK